MTDLESRIAVPFATKQYHFDLVWRTMTVGKTTLSFTPISAQDLPSEARKVYYSNGNLYKVDFHGTITAPVLRWIFEHGSFTSYVCVTNNDAHPLLSIACTKNLCRTSRMTSLYNRSNNTLTINDQQRPIPKEIMQTLRDPVSHVLHLLFRSRSTEGTYFCGHYHDAKGALQSLDVTYARHGTTLLGTACIPAQAYLLDTEVRLELPYSYDECSKKFIPSLTERVAVSHRIGKITLEFTGFDATKAL